MPTQAQPDGLRLLIEWANEQDHWVRAVASEVIAIRRELSEKSVDAAYAMLLAEKGLSQDAPPNIAELSIGAAPAELAEELRLVRLAKLSGVNALANGQEIAFNPRLTVLFGENAAGKTGYVRVLKRVASVRSAQPILGNVHVAAAGKPHATIDYSLSGKAQSLEWNDETGVPPFTRISVFDSSVVTLHVDDDLTYVFTPGELALFLYVHRAIEGVKARLEREKNDAAAKGANPFLHRFSRDTVVYPKIETIGPSTSIPDLDALANVTPEEEAGIPTLRDRVEALQPRSVESRLQVATSDRDLYGGALKAAKAAEAFSWDAYNAAVEDVRKAAERYDTVSKTAFSGENVPGIFGETWRAFIVAGETYLRDTGAPAKPQNGDHCPYCRQDLNEKALALVQKYHDFCNNEPKRALDVATTAMKRLVGPITSLSIATAKDASERRRDAFNDPTAVPPSLPKAIAFFAQLERFHGALVAGRAVAETDALRDAATELARDTAAEVAKAEEAIASLRKQADERKKDLETEAAKLRLLENRLTLRAILPEVRAYVERAQWAGKATPLVTRTTSVLRSLTERSKLASKELLDKDFERLFQVECEALRAPKVQLDFAGRKGQAARKKTLVPDHRLSEILSEGEQKVIALADFLAEAGLHRTTAPIVFDDPVNSLDYRRIREIATRIVALSAERQVILFTHEILLVMEVVSLLEHTPTNFSYFSVEDIDGQVGVVTSGAQPRLDSLADLKGKINRLIQDAGTQTGETRAALIEKAYEVLRAWVEVFVEKEISAVQRYSPHISVTALDNIRADRLPAARAVIRPLYEKACRCIASHSQPAHTLGIRPTLDELKQDWQKAQAARTDYQAN